MKQTAIDTKSTILMYSQHVDGDVLIWVITCDENAELFHKKVVFDKEKFKSLQYLVEATRTSIDVRARSIFSDNERKKGKQLLHRHNRDSIPIHLGEDNMMANEEFNVNDLYQVSAQLAKLDINKSSIERIKTLYDEDNNEKAEAATKRKAKIEDKKNIIIKNGLEELYKILIQPIEDALKDENRLLIVPFGDLFSLPFAALLDQNGKHLIEKYNLSFAPSIGTLVNLQHRNNKNSKSTSCCDTMPSSENKTNTLIVGNPDYHGWTTQLPGAQAEAKKVCSITKSAGFETNIIEGADATKAAVIPEMEKAAIIHIASHGTHDGIYLSGKTKKEGKLTMGEVQDLSLDQSKMVVLSACDTFKGDLRTDGVIGITRAFIAAGASTVIASMWPVGDSSTQEMMNRLYQILCKKRGQSNNNMELDVCSALREAMIGMLKDGYSVQAWAPFLVYGLSTAAVGNMNKNEKSKEEEEFRNVIIDSSSEMYILTHTNKGKEEEKRDDDEERKQYRSAKLLILHLSLSSMIVFIVLIFLRYVIIHYVECI